METIGERIKTLRKSIGFNQKEFSNKIGISQGSLSDIEKGRNKPSIQTLIEISGNFNVSIDWLIKGNFLDNKFRNNARILLDQVIKEIIKIFYDFKHKLMEENKFSSEELALVFDIAVLSLYRKSFTEEQFHLLQLYKSLPIKDQEDIRLFVEVKNQSLTKGM
jgi:transcriptional regulator with XRE-family HTH domain